MIPYGLLTFLTDAPSADGKPPCGQTGASFELGKDSLRFELRVVWKEAFYYYSGANLWIWCRDISPLRHIPSAPYRQSFQYGKDLPNVGRLPRKSGRMLACGTSATVMSVFLRSNCTGRGIWGSQARRKDIRWSLVWLKWHISDPMRQRTLLIDWHARPIPHDAGRTVLCPRQRQAVDPV